MHTLKLIALTFVQFLKQAWLLPQSIASGFKQHRLQSAKDVREAERLDRIRNPSKYLGR